MKSLSDWRYIEKCGVITFTILTILVSVVILLLAGPENLSRSQKRIGLEENQDNDPPDSSPETLEPSSVTEN